MCSFLSPSKCRRGSDYICLGCLLRCLWLLSLILSWILVVISSTTLWSDSATTAVDALGLSVDVLIGHVWHAGLLLSVLICGWCCLCVVLCILRNSSDRPISSKDKCVFSPTNTISLLPALQVDPLLRSCLLSRTLKLIAIHLLVLLLSVSRLSYVL